MNGIEAFLEILHRAGVRHLFGNPGTTELPLNDALVHDRRFQYVLGLHEIPVVAMADGYAMASGRVAVANVHVSCGLGNSLGMLYNAHVEGTPLLLTAGQQDRRLLFDEPVLVGDLVSVARPWTKWAAEVPRVEDIPNAVRRAMQIASTPPTGPVFLSLPVDVQMAPAEGVDCSPPWVPDRRVRPALDGIAQAAKVLAAAKNPCILAGSRVTEAGACAELAEIATRLGAPVFAEAATMHGRLPIASDHPLYSGTMPLWGDLIEDKLKPFDVALVVGMHLFRLYIPRGREKPMPDHLKLVQIDCDPNQIGKNYPVEVGLAGDPKTTLAELATLLPAPSQEARGRAEAIGHQQLEARDKLRGEIAAQWNSKPLTPLALMGALAKALPERTAVVEEAVTTHQNTLERLGLFRDPTSHFAHRGWALGWGLGCALGVKLAWPERPVLGLLGDGASLYGIQGLWTAARYQIPVTFVICNNAQYKILKNCGDVMPLPNMARREYLGMDLVGPQVDFVGLAKSFGVEAVRVDNADAVADCVRESLLSGRPKLIDVPISG